MLKSHVSDSLCNNCVLETPFWTLAASRAAEKSAECLGRDRGASMAEVGFLFKFWKYPRVQKSRFKRYFEDHLDQAWEELAEFGVPFGMSSLCLWGSVSIGKQVWKPSRVNGVFLHIYMYNIFIYIYIYISVCGWSCICKSLAAGHRRTLSNMHILIASWVCTYRCFPSAWAQIWDHPSFDLFPISSKATKSGGKITRIPAQWFPKTAPRRNQLEFQITRYLMITTAFSMFWPHAASKECRLS